MKKRLSQNLPIDFVERLTLIFDCHEIVRCYHYNNKTTEYNVTF